MSISLYLLLIFLSGCLTAAPRPQPKCPARRVIEADHCASKLFIIGQKSSTNLRSMPRNPDEMRQYCSTVRKASKCLKIYSNQCLPPFPKQLSSVLYRAVDNSSAKLCNSGQANQEFVRKASCVNNGIEGMHNCMDKYIETLELVKKAEARYKIAFTCCTSQGFRNCMEKQLSAICPPESYSYLHDMVMSYASEVLDTMCGQYTGPSSKEKCSGLPALPPRDREARSGHSLSPYTPIMEIFSNF